MIHIHYHLQEKKEISVIAISIFHLAHINLRVVFFFLHIAFVTAVYCALLPANTFVIWMALQCLLVPSLPLLLLLPHLLGRRQLLSLTTDAAHGSFMWCPHRHQNHKRCTAQDSHLRAEKGLEATII